MMSSQRPFPLQLFVLPCGLGVISAMAAMNNCSDFGRGSFVNLAETREYHASEGVVFDPDQNITDEIFGTKSFPAGDDASKFERVRPAYEERGLPS